MNRIQGMRKGKGVGRRFSLIIWYIALGSLLREILNARVGFRVSRPAANLECGQKPLDVLTGWHFGWEIDTGITRVLVLLPAQIRDYWERELFQMGHGHWWIFLRWKSRDNYENPPLIYRLCQPWITIKPPLQRGFNPLAVLFIFFVFELGQSCVKIKWK